MSMWDFAIEYPFVVAACLVFLGGIAWWGVYGVRMTNEESRLHGFFMAFTMLLLLCALSGRIWWHLERTDEVDSWRDCYSSLMMVGNFIAWDRTQKDGAFIMVDKWYRKMCDICDEEELSFFDAGMWCPMESNSGFGFALNENLIGKSISEIHGTVVVLFETNTGQNAVSGPESMVFRHGDGQKCNILLADGTIVRISESGANELKWKP